MSPLTMISITLRTIGESRVGSYGCTLSSTLTRVPSAMWKCSSRLQRTNSECRLLEVTTVLEQRVGSEF